MAYPVPLIAGVPYFPLPDNFVPYRYEDEVAVVPLLGRDPALADRNEFLQTSAHGAQVCTFAALAEGNAAKDALVALWATVRGSATSRSSSSMWPSPPGPTRRRRCMS